MITIIIVLFIGFLLYVTGSNGEWGPFAVGALILVAVIAIGSAVRSDSKAYGNFIDYWADDERNRRR